MADVDAGELKRPREAGRWHRFAEPGKGSEQALELAFREEQ